MHLITHGRIKVNGSAVNGQLLLTDRSLFVLDSGTAASSTGGAVGGLLGYFIGRYFERRKAKKQPPAHLQDPEIASLGAKVQDSLLTTRLLAKLPVDGTLEIKPTRFGI